MARGKIFISYSHRDKKALENWLKPALEADRELAPRVWYDNMLDPGDNWLDEIEGRLGETRVAVLWVTMNFLGSRFIKGHELPRVLRAQEQAGLRIVPIAAAPFDHETSPVKMFQAANSVQRPLNSLVPWKRDEALVTIVRTIRKHIDASDADEARAKPSSRVVLVHRQNAIPDEEVGKALGMGLRRAGVDVVTGKGLVASSTGLKEMRQQLETADAVISLVSASSARDEDLEWYIQEAQKEEQNRKGKPALLSVRVRYSNLFDGRLAMLGAFPSFSWDSDQDTPKVIRSLLEHLDPEKNDEPASALLHVVRGSANNGGEPYLLRGFDRDLDKWIHEMKMIVCVKSGKQMGKTSLLASVLRRAAERGSTVVSTDFRLIRAVDLSTIERFYGSLIESLADQLRMQIDIEKLWSERRPPNSNLKNFLIQHVLVDKQRNVVWGLDDADRLFDLPYGEEFFAMLRSWHEERRRGQTPEWERLCTVITYGVEADRLIKNQHQSPFNVGEKLDLYDFTENEVGQLNQTMGDVLETPELKRFYAMVGGHPQLVCEGLRRVMREPLDAFLASACHSTGPYGDHLRRLAATLALNPKLAKAIQRFLNGEGGLTQDDFFSLRTAGILTGASNAQAQIRCGLYRIFLSEYLVGERLGQSA